jgi:hypothetical protein
MTINAHPLAWPVGWKRTDAHRRRHAKFGKKVTSPGSSWSHRGDLTVAEGVQRVLAELQRMGIRRDDCVISTNVPTRLDGLPRSDAKRPADPGAAVYWQDPYNKAPRVMAIDQYSTVEDNLAAIAATLDAMRAIERHGGAVILERAFSGFTALPAPAVKREWWEVLGVPRNSTREDVKAAYRRLASAAHPDKPGGSHERMAELNAAQEAALLECFE